MSFSVGVIGLGRMAQALVRPLVESGSLRGSDLIAVVGQESSVARLKPELPSEITLID